MRRYALRRVAQIVPVMLFIAIVDVIVERLPATMLLVLASQIPAIVLGTLLGAFSASLPPRRSTAW